MRSCARCHAAEAADWVGSIHARAASPGLLGQLPIAGPHAGEGLSCLLCHAPLAAQQPVRIGAGQPRPRPGSPIESLVAQLTRRDSPLAVEPNPRFDAAQQAEGVGCAACHARGEAMVGPFSPVKEALAPHPVRGEAFFRDPAFCAACHQLGQASAVNGKPLENTYEEWRQSIWGEDGATCQSCHMPDGRHLFRGIHAPDLVAASVQVSLVLAEGTGARGELSVFNDAVGHAFPTYTTPRVVLSVGLEDARGKPLGAPQTMAIGRTVHWADGAWHEDADTRVLPRQKQSLHFDLPRLPGAIRLRAKVEVEPDWAYVGLFQRIMEEPELSADHRRLIRKALDRAMASGFTIFEQTRALGSSP